MNRLVAAFLLLTTVSAFAEDPKAPTRAVQVVIPIIYDGDTIRGSLVLGWGVWIHDVSIRAFGYDCHEITKQRQTIEVTDEEIAKGKAAKYALTELLETGNLYAEESGERDPYGRTSAILWVKTNKGEWIYLARFMEQNGHLRVPRTK